VSAQGSDYRSPYLWIRVIVVSLREESSHYDGAKRKTFARWQKHAVKKDKFSLSKSLRITKAA
jgi:hypothetical protein